MNREEPVLVSVVIPCYNCKDTQEALYRAVDSVLAQSVSLELLLVDDGSTDGTAELFDAYARNTRVHVIKKENGGVSSARNAGMEAARGEWVAFVDADDALHPHALDTLLHAAQAQDDIVVGGYTVVYTSEEGRTQYFLPPQGDKMQAIESLIRTDSALCSMCARLYRRAFLMENALRAPPGVRVGEDVLFNLDAFYAARAFTCVCESVYTYYLGGDSAMGRAQTDFFGAQRPMLAGINAFLERNDLKTTCFRAHLDTYVRQLRKGKGRLRAALAFGKEARVVTQGVNTKALTKKEACYYHCARSCGILTYLMP